MTQYPDFTLELIQPKILVGLPCNKVFPIQPIVSSYTRIAPPNVTKTELTLRNVGKS